MGESVNLQEYLDEKLSLGETDLRTYSPLTLAYIGDAVYDMVIRTALVKKGNCQVQKLSRRASRIVNAGAQAQLAGRILPLLTEEELSVYKRGCNAKPHTKAKNASFLEYHRATGLEALVGYLYLKKDTKRALDLICAGLEGEEL